jgi:hypothetical protein
MDPDHGIRGVHRLAKLAGDPATLAIESPDVKNVGRGVGHLEDL